MKLFITAFVQVFLVSANAYFISRLYWVGIAFCGFGISFFWSINVKKIAFSTTKERLIYSQEQPQNTFEQKMKDYEEKMRRLDNIIFHINKVILGVIERRYDRKK